MREAVKKNGVVIYKWLRRFFGKIFFNIYRRYSNVEKNLLHNRKL